MRSSRCILKDVAKEAGVHLATASRALKEGSPVAPATRQAVLRAARKLGYKPDPMLSALAAYRSSSLPVRSQGVIAWLDVWQPESKASKIFHHLFQQAKQRAKDLGWSLQEFSIAETGAARLGDILLARGVAGVVVPPMPPGQRTIPDFPWEHFSAATVGHTLAEPRLHRVIPDHVGNMERILQAVTEAGFRRPALVLDRDAHERSHHLWENLFLAYQTTLKARNRLKPFFGVPAHITTQAEFDRCGFLDYVKKTTPDVILTNWATFAQTTLGRLPTQDIPQVFGINLRFGFPGPGIEENFGPIGMALANGIVGMIHRREKGPQAHPLQLLIQGTWNPGPCA